MWTQQIFIGIDVSTCIHQDCRNKGFMFTIKKVWDRVCSPENLFLISAVSHISRPLPL